MASPHHNALPQGYRLHWYVVESVLGKGGFGITYLATDTNLEQKVAIKEFLPAELATRSGDSTVHPITENHSDTYGWGLTRFLHEARTLAKFRHESVVRVLSVFEANNTAYMVMEFEEGQSLENAYKFRKIRGEKALSSMLFALLDGLETVHEAGFIHRDIKPDNIYLRDDGSPVLLDFGSARQAIGAETRTLTALVSPGYAPFEQYDSSRDGDKKQGPWTDIYSLGATLYCGITGNGPPDAMQRVNAVVGGKDLYLPAADIAPEGFSADFLAAIDAALAFLPEDRPQSIQQWRRLFATAPDVSASGEIDSADAATVLREPPAPEISEAAAGGHDAHPAAPLSQPDKAATAGSGSRTRRLKAAASAALFLALLIGGALTWRHYGPVSSLPPADGEAARPADAEPREPTQEGAARQPAEASRRRADEIVLEAEKAGIQAEAESREAAALAAQRLVTESIAGLLARAGEDYEAGRLVSPENDNAWRKYREVLELDGANAQANAGLDRIVRGLVASADLSIAESDFDSATERLDQAARVRPGSIVVEAGRQRLGTARAARRRKAEEVAAREKAGVLADLLARAEAASAAGRFDEAASILAQAESMAPGSGRVETARNRLAAVRTHAGREDKIAGLLAEAEADLNAARLTSPAGNNAYERYRAVLEIEPGHAQAREGMESIVSRYLAMAERAKADRNFDKAGVLLNRAKTVIPGSARIEEARNALDAARNAHLASPEKATAAMAEAQRAERENEALAAAQAEVHRLRAEQARLQAALTKNQADAGGGTDMRSGIPRIIILPFGHSATCYSDRFELIVDSLARISREAGGVELVGSAYGSRTSGIAANETLAAFPLPRDRDEAVSGLDSGAGAGRKGLPEATHALTGWIHCTNHSTTDTRGHPIDFSLVNLATGRVEGVEAGTQYQILETLKRLLSSL